MLSIIGQEKELSERKIGENKSKINLSLNTDSIYMHSFINSPGRDTHMHTYQLYGLNKV